MEQVSNKDNLSPGFESVGQILKYYRRLKNLSLEEVSKRTYIKEKYLYALEENIIDIMPSSVYACSYVKQYSKLLGLDGKELVKLYKKQFNLFDNDSVAGKGNESSLGSLEKEKIMGNDTTIEIKESKASITGDLEPLREGFKEASLELKLTQNKVSSSTSTNKTNGSNGNGNGNGHGKHNNEPTKTIVQTNNTDVNGNGSQPPKKEEKMSKEIEDSIDQAERIIDQAKKDGDKYVRESKEYSRQVKNEANQYLKQVKAYADYLLIAVERELTGILEEIQSGRDILKNQQK